MGGKNELGVFFLPPQQCSGKVQRVQRPQRDRERLRGAIENVPCDVDEMDIRHLLCQGLITKGNFFD